MMIYSPEWWNGDYTTIDRIITDEEKIKLFFTKDTETPIHTNCPNCGAPMESNHCEYCGSNF